MGSIPVYEPETRVRIPPHPRRLASSRYGSRRTKSFGTGHRGWLAQWVERLSVHRATEVRILAHPRDRDTRHRHVQSLWMIGPGCAQLVPNGTCRESAGYGPPASNGPWRTWCNGSTGSMPRVPGSSPDRPPQGPTGSDIRKDPPGQAGRGSGLRARSAVPKGRPGFESPGAHRSSATLTGIRTW